MNHIIGLQAIKVHPGTNSLILIIHPTPGDRECTRALGTVHKAFDHSSLGIID